ncbi:hypothetical protein KJ966_12865 [bacterium]|nr:hypothetical protein [bacterium]
MSALLSAFIGLVFLLTAGFKVFFALPFITHTRKFKLIPERLNALLAVLFIEMEAGLGMAMVLHLYPLELIPFTIGLILFFSIVTWWGIKTGRTQDCGCYGAFLNLELWQTLVLNAGYILILLVAWLNTDQDDYNEFWKVGIVLATILIFHFTLKRTVKKPLFSIFGLRKGNFWKQNWYQTDKTPHDYLFVFLDESCQECREWISQLNEIYPHLNHFNLIGLMPMQFDGTDESKELIPCFPIHKLNAIVFYLLMGQIPLAVLVKQHRINMVWRKVFPEELFSRNH